MSGAEMSGAEISGAEMSGAEMSGVEISGAEMSRGVSLSDRKSKFFHFGFIYPIQKLKFYNLSLTKFTLQILYDFWI